MNGAAKFQSHIGAIRIPLASAEFRDLQRFQSHIGAIRILCFYLPLLYLPHFNPTLVQLEFENALDAERSELNFNPTLVQLESSISHAVSRSPRISIPHWCN